MNSSSWSAESFYREQFRALNGVAPYPYQVRLAELLTSGASVCLRAPTGSGKTRAVLTPFVINGLDWTRGRPTRLIYALPLRSLVQQVHAEAKRLLAASGHPDWEATSQTGEQPDDEFFDRGRVIITTYDQLLSGLLCAPYGLSHRQRNLNAAAVVGSLIVFDEFHLMGLRTALLTSAASLRLFQGLTQAVWMTATATAAPVEELRNALGCRSLELTPAETRELPVVATTERTLRREAAALTADEVQARASGRTIVIVNTVERAQALYRSLEPWASERRIPLICLHARFFKADRAKRIQELYRLFGEGSSGPAILIATQVVEAGIDISCDHLLTELCPMNALLQRAGRCARFRNERGVVHVYSLPAEGRSWLPYGSLEQPDPALEATDRVLSEQEQWTMRPDLPAHWVERVHSGSDAASLALGGWRDRLNRVRTQIQNSLTLGRVDGSSQLIREDDDTQIRIIVARRDDLPRTPAYREAVSASRWSLRKILLDTQEPVAWYWDLAADTPNWCELRTEQELQRAVIVCVSPEVAGYSATTGLQIGLPSDAVSPVREPPPRPGYGTLRVETWVGHTRGVAREIDQRARQATPETLAGRGLADTYGITSEQLAEILHACAWLHDLGKLQQRWQAWAEAYQRDRDPNWTPHEPLAHTDFDPENLADVDRARRVGQRGPHAVASAWYGMVLLQPILGGLPKELIAPVASACTAAILAHHGGWLPATGETLDVTPLIPDWDQWVRKVMGIAPAGAAVEALKRQPNPRGFLAKLLDETMNPHRLEKWFALVAYLKRTLRLSDRRATAEGGEQ